MARECPDASRNLGERLVQGVVNLHVCEVVVIQARTAKLRVIHVESQRLHKVQHGTRTCGQANSGSRIAGDFRLPKNNVQHSPQAWWVTVRDARAIVCSSAANEAMAGVASSSSPSESVSRACTVNT